MRFFHLSWNDLRGLVSERTAILAVMAVVLYLGTGIAYHVLKLQLIRMRPAPATAVAKAPAAQAEGREPADAYRAVAERNLFKTTTVSVTAKQQGPPPPDVSTLFELRGTVAGDAKAGFAIVEEKATRKQRLVKAGDNLSGAKVVRVKRNALDLLIDEQERTLTMVERREAPMVPAASAPRPAATPPPAAVTAAAASGATVIDRSEVTASLQDMGSMLRQAQVRPYFNAGAPDGFMITGIQPGSLYQRMGIVNGDIIQGVDGRNIRTAEDMVTLYNTLKNNPAVGLSIRRSGKQETLNYQFR